MKRQKKYIVAWYSSEKCQTKLVNLADKRHICNIKNEPIGKYEVKLSTMLIVDSNNLKSERIYKPWKCTLT